MSLLFQARKYVSMIDKEEDDDDGVIVVVVVVVVVGATVVVLDADANASEVDVVVVVVVVVAPPTAVVNLEADDTNPFENVLLGLSTISETLKPEAMRPDSESTV